MAKPKTRTCVRGTACGSSCIRKGFKCRIDLPRPISNKLNEVVAYLKDPDQKSLGMLSYLAVREAEGKVILKTKGLLDPNEVNWKAGVQEGAEFVGGGSYGNFILVPDKQINPSLKLNGVAGLKSGEIGDNEADVMTRVGPLGLGPNLIAARTTYDAQGRSVGQIAMTIVPGVVMIKAPDTINGITPRDSYWKLRIALHKAGVYHGDLHNSNVIIDSEGKARAVDFGLSKLDYRFALAEAMKGVLGIDYSITVPDDKSYSPGAASDISIKAKGNIPKLLTQLADMGWTKTEIEKFDKYGVMKDNITEAQSKRLIDTLYEGI
jgi:hypothetical protein